MLKLPRFSVLMAFYAKDDPDHLRQAMGSICSQTLLPDEVVLVQDGQVSQKLSSVIDGFTNLMNLKLLVSEDNFGLARALNLGLAHCTHDLVIRMDADDVSYPNRFETQIRFMASHEGIDASSCIVEEWCGELKLLLGERKLPVNHSSLVKFGKIRSPLNHPAVVYRKSKVIAAGGYPPSFPEDHFLWIKLIRSGAKLANLDTPLVQMRCGEEMLARRGLPFLLGEIRLLNQLWKWRQLTVKEYLTAMIGRIILRVAPVWVRRFLYKKFR